MRVAFDGDRRHTKAVSKARMRARVTSVHLFAHRLTYPVADADAQDSHPPNTMGKRKSSSKAAPKTRKEPLCEYIPEHFHLETMLDCLDA